MYPDERRKTGIEAVVSAVLKQGRTYTEALRDVSFTVGRGEIAGLIGPNGAGKTTVVKVLSGFLTPDSGECAVMGITPWDNRDGHIRNVGVVTGHRMQLQRDTPAADSFAKLQEIYGIPHEIYRRNFKDLIEMFSLADIMQTPMRQLSWGQRMRCEMAAALLHGPSLLLLDEPTLGLDAASASDIHNLIKRVNRAYGTTILLTTQEITEVETLPDRVMLIGKGRLLFDGSFEQMQVKFEDRMAISRHSAEEITAETFEDY
jgi:ABC-2 type transport system ATP-binding protein